MLRFDFCEFGVSKNPCDKPPNRWFLSVEKKGMSLCNQHADIVKRIYTKYNYDVEEISKEETIMRLSLE